MSSSRRAWKHRTILSALALSMATSAVPAHPTWQADTGGGSETCASAWSATNVYTNGSTVSVGAVSYTANYWSQGADPSTHNGGAGSREPWTANGHCSGVDTASPPLTDADPLEPGAAIG